MLNKERGREKESKTGRDILRFEREKGKGNLNGEGERRREKERYSTGWFRIEYPIKYYISRQIVE